jgi:hypothetical protein
MRVIRNIDDFLFEEQQAQAIAGAGIQPWQRELKTGDFFLRRFEDIAIYSEVLPSTEDDEDGKEVVVEGGDYRFTNSFSIHCPEGELGDVHLSEVGRTITRAQFESFRASGWPSYAEARVVLARN